MVMDALTELTREFWKDHWVLPNPPERYSKHLILYYSTDEASKIIAYVVEEYILKVFEASGIQHMVLKDQDLTLNNIEEACKVFKPDYIHYYGHGNVNLISDYKHEVLMEVCKYPEIIVKERKFHMLSCLSGAGLGLDMKLKGASEVKGYRQVYYFAYHPYYGPPHANILTMSFFYPDIIRQYYDLLGLTSKNAEAKAYQQYYRNFEILYYINPLIASLLKWDAEAMVMY